MNVQHHIKYKELDGIDETVLMSKSEHDKLHKNIHFNEIYGISQEEFIRISGNAHVRQFRKTHREKHIQECKKYYEEHKNKYKEYELNKKFIVLSVYEKIDNRINFISGKHILSFVCNEIGYNQKKDELIFNSYFLSEFY